MRRSSAAKTTSRPRERWSCSPVFGTLADFGNYQPGDGRKIVVFDLYPVKRSILPISARPIVVIARVALNDFTTSSCSVSSSSFRRPVLRQYLHWQPVRHSATPYSSITIAICTRAICISLSSSEIGLVSAIPPGATDPDWINKFSLPSRQNLSLHVNHAFDVIYLIEINRQARVFFLR